MSIYLDDGDVVLHHGDCREVMAAMPAESVDAIVCDPPYGLGFMGKEWDDAGRMGTFTEANTRLDKYPRTGKGPVAVAFDGLAFQAWCVTWATEALRVLKPGGYMISAGGSRTYHRMTCAIEDAGFEIRDCITWLYGAGFPKSLNVSAALRSLPACACDVPGELGTVDPVLPAGAVGAGVGAEAGAVPLAGLPADGARRVGPEVVPGPSRTVADVEHGVEDVDREAAPVVLRASPVAGVAARDEVRPLVGGVQVDPEALRDGVVGEGGDAPAVDARPRRDDLGADGVPPDALVLPLATTPGGVALAGEAAAVGDGHARPGAVDAGRDVAGEIRPALGAGEGCLRHPSKCKACGGVRGEILDGFGTALKPAAEFFVVARKPLSGTVAGNVLAHGTGALNIDGCRVGTGEDKTPAPTRRGASSPWFTTANAHDLGGNDDAGRWPANVVLDEEAAEMLDEAVGERPGMAPQRLLSTDPGETNCYGRYAERQHNLGVARGDTGGPSRFFYTAKASTAERDGATHPTVKPLALMRWLVRLVTPPGGVVLDPFAGSGTTLLAARDEGYRAIGIEREEEYAAMAAHRLRQLSLLGGVA